MNFMNCQSLKELAINVLYAVLKFNAAPTQKKFRRNGFYELSVFNEVDINVLYVVFKFNGAGTHKKYLQNGFYELSVLRT